VWDCVKRNGLWNVRGRCGFQRLSAVGWREWFRGRCGVRRLGGIGRREWCRGWCGVQHLGGISRQKWCKGRWVFRCLGGIDGSVWHCDRWGVQQLGCVGGNLWHCGRREGHRLVRISCYELYLQISGTMLCRGHNTATGPSLMHHNIFPNSHYFVARSFDAAHRVAGALSCSTTLSLMGTYLYFGHTGSNLHNAEAVGSAGVLYSACNQW
jgi:hypothetical protein